MKPNGIGDIDIAYNTARAIENEWQQAEALAQLASQLPANLVIEAIAAGNAFVDDWAQGTALVALAPRLAELGYNLEALHAISTIRRGYSQAKALQRTMPYLPESAYNEAITLANTIVQPENRSVAWAGIVPFLKGDSQVEAIQTAQATVDAIAPGPIQAEAQAELDALLERLGYYWDEAVNDVEPDESPTPVAAAEDFPVPVEVPARVTLAPQSATAETPPVQAVPAHIQVNQAARAAFTWLNQHLIDLGLDTGQILAHPKTEQYLNWTRGKYVGGLQLVWLVPLLLSMACVTSLFLSGLFIGGVIVAASPQVVETLAVASDGDSIISKTSLRAGEMYTIAVSGRFRYNISQPESWADAQSTYFQQTDSWLPAYWVSIDGQKVVAQQADTSQHLYLFYVEGHGRPIKFRIEERRTTEYVDNDGALVVDIYPGVVALEEIQ